MTNSRGGCRMRLLRISSFCRGKLRRISNPTSADIFLQFIFGLLGRKKNIPSKVLSHINVGLLMDAYLTFPETSSSSSSRKFKTKTKNLLNSCTIVLFVCSQPTLYNCTRWLERWSCGYLVEMQSGMTDVADDGADKHKVFFVIVFLSSFNCLAVAVSVKGKLSHKCIH